jgi:diphosphomevalonate decarboxylase
MIARIRTSPNIALLKYWGKRNRNLNLPLNSSISLGLDGLVTETEVEFQPSGDIDIQLNGLAADAPTVMKVMNVIDSLRIIAKQRGHDLAPGVRVHSENHFPTAAGLASSASGLAGVAIAASRAAGIDLDTKTLSQLARVGSGSASRSVLGNFVIWHRGQEEHGEDSWAESLQAHPDLKAGFVVCVLSEAKKSVSSTDGMNRTVASSIYTDEWAAWAQRVVPEFTSAIEHGDFARLGELTEQSTFKMHATTLGAEKPFTYLGAGTWRIIETVQRLRASGYPAYVTMDAGPNVKILVQDHRAEAIESALHGMMPDFPGLQTFYCRGGGAPVTLDQDS